MCVCVCVCVIVCSQYFMSDGLHVQSLLIAQGVLGHGHWIGKVLLEFIVVTNVL